MTKLGWSLLMPHYFDTFRGDKDTICTQGWDRDDGVWWGEHGACLFYVLPDSDRAEYVDGPTPAQAKLLFAVILNSVLDEGRWFQVVTDGDVWGLTSHVPQYCLPNDKGLTLTDLSHKDHVLSVSDGQKIRDFLGREVPAWFK